MRIRQIIENVKLRMPASIYEPLKKIGEPIYQRINYSLLPLVVKKKLVLTMDKMISDSFVVSTANGLFLVEGDKIFELLEGNFYGITIWRDKILVYISYGYKGKIIAFQKGSENEKGRCNCILSDLPHGCHQIDCFRNNLYITDTYNNRIINLELQSHMTSEYFPLGVLSNGRNSSNYAHINSIYFYNNKVLIYCHNESTKTNRKSTILESDKQFNIKDIIQTDSENGHNVVHYNGCLYHCDSMGKSLKRDNDIVFEADSFTRGLSITPEWFVVGGSEFADKQNRSNTKGYLYFLKSDFNLYLSCEIPGPVHEIRQINGMDYSLSDSILNQQHRSIGVSL